MNLVNPIKIKQVVEICDVFHRKELVTLCSKLMIYYKIATSCCLVHDPYTDTTINCKSEFPRSSGFLSVLLHNDVIC